jgi:UDP-N-acetylmuramoyl-tripeptide--D-alanyl-D-alanine ligase
MTIEELYTIYLQHPSVQTDTRKLKNNDIFFALKGGNYNGNHFALLALEKGAAFAVVDEDIPGAGNRIIRTPNVLETLQQLAKFHRRRFLEGDQEVPFIAITGSNGKTTTKELVHAVLSSAYKTYTTAGNLNNHIGVPLTLLQVKADAEMAVIEMGANHLNEIFGYCEYAQPTHGLITNIGKAHIEGFGSIDNIKKGKGELFAYLGATGGTAFVNADDAAIVDLGRDVSTVVLYGLTGDETSGTVTASDPCLQVAIGGDSSFEIKTRLVGAYNLLNVLAAVCVGRYFKIADDKIKEAIENYTPSNSRSQLLHRGSNTIILDAYNANPSSMKAAIENFAAMKGDKKILLLGAMMELGRESEQEHAGVISIIDNYTWDAVVLVGESFRNLPHRYINFDNALQVREWMQSKHFENAYILIKGSRSMQMEKVLE